MVLHAAAGLAARGHRVDVVLCEPSFAYSDDVSQQVRFVILCGRGAWERRNLARMPPTALWQSEGLPVTRAGRLFAEMLGNHGTGCLPFLRRRRVLVFALRLARYFETAQPDIVFTNHIHSDFAALFSAKLAPGPFVPPIVPIIHTAMKPGSALARRRGLLFPEFSHFVAVSQGIAECLISVCRVPRDKVTTIGNPAYSSDIARRAKAKPDHPWFTDGGPPIILSVGRLSSDKDFFTLLDAFRIVLRSGSPFRLLILGEGKRRRALERRVLSLGLADQVSMPGWSDNPYASMTRAALFVLSSHQEAFGLVLVEALACGCPAVATDGPGPSEILRDPDLLAPPGNPNALAQIMLQALNRPWRSDDLRAKAAQFSIERAAIAYEALITAIKDRDGHQGRK